MMRSRGGFTLIELSMVVTAAAILAGALMPNYIRSLRIEAGKKTALEMSQVSEAVRGYCVNRRAWPSSLDDLKAQGFMDAAWEGKNPFQEAYTLQLNGANLDIVTTLPVEIAPVTAALLPMAVLNGGVVRSSVTWPGALSAAVPVGVIVPWAAQDIPPGWIVCDGRAISRVDYAGLFGVIGIFYGHGNGVTTFNVPDLRGRVVAGLDDMGQGRAFVITHPAGNNLGGMFGAEKHRLTMAEMPSHSHTYSQAFSGGRYDGHSSPLFNISQSAQSGSAGENQPHNNLQPSIALYWIIKS